MQPQNNSEQSLSNGIVILVFLTVILTGLHGLVSIIFLMAVSRLNFGRDPEDKHGVSSGASRLGGLAIMFSLLSGIALNSYISEDLSYVNLKDEFSIILFSFLVGLIGLVEDLKQNLSSILRLFSIIFIVLIALTIMSFLIPFKLGLFASMNEPLRIIFIYVFTILMIAGFINAGNIADGANGLLSLSYLAFFYCLNVIDPSIPHLSIIVSLVIFMIFNIGTGKIFLGDFGAYFLSALVAFSSLKIYQEHDISVFFFATILIYPCFELTRSLIFRFINKASVMSADNNHLHNKVNHYFLSTGLNPHQANSMTGVFLSFVSTSLPTYLFYTGVSLKDDLWVGLFIFEFLLLCSIYLLLTKINLMKI